MRYLFVLFFLCSVQLLSSGFLYSKPFARATNSTDFQGNNAAPISAIEKTRALVKEITQTSYPELADAEIRIVLFNNRSDYFRTRFAIPQYMTGQRMRYILSVNPEVFSRNCPDAAIRAIIAHEIGHVLFFSQRNRLRLLGLVRLESKNYTAEFERWTDLQAISRGYGEGLKEYRRWLYQNVPQKSLAEKRRDYFSPEEIDAILGRLKAHPELMNYWFTHIPHNIN